MLKSYLMICVSCRQRIHKYQTINKKKKRFLSSYVSIELTVKFLEKVLCETEKDIAIIAFYFLFYLSLIL